MTRASKKKLIAKLTANIVPGPSNLPDLNNDPFVIKKKEEMIKFLKKHGLPKGSKGKLEDL
jgi:hypothetical protein